MREWFEKAEADFLAVGNSEMAHTCREFGDNIDVIHAYCQTPAVGYPPGVSGFLAECAFELLFAQMHTLNLGFVK